MTSNEYDRFDNFVISIGKFLSHYYCISGTDFNKLSHEAFMEIFNLKALPIRYVRLDDVITGKVLLVTDVYGKTLGYKNPFTKKRNEENQDFFIRSVNINFDDDNVTEIDIGNLKLKELSDYELDRLLVISKKLKDERVKCKIIKELKLRPESKAGIRKNLVEAVRKREFVKIKGEMKK